MLKVALEPKETKAEVKADKLVVTAKATKTKRARRTLLVRI